MKPLLAVLRDVYVSQIQSESAPVVHEPIHGQSKLSYSNNFVVLLVLSCLPSFGSTIVVWLNPDGIVATADSLELDDTRGTIREVMTCKIQPVGTFYIATAGIPRIFDADRPSETLYSAIETARDVAARSSGIKDMMSQFIEVTESRFQVAMLRFFQQSPTQFMSEVNGKRGALSVVLFEMTQNGPMLGVVDFTVAAIPSGIRVDHSLPQYCPDVCDLLHGAVVRLGAQDTGVGPQPTNLDEAISWVVGIVKAEIDADMVRSERDKKPVTVGGPISVLTLTRSVTRWPDGYHETCPEQPK